MDEDKYKNRLTKDYGATPEKRTKAGVDRYELDRLLLGAEKNKLLHGNKVLDLSALPAKPATFYIGGLSVLLFFGTLGPAFSFFQKNIPGMTGMVLMLIYFISGLAVSPTIGGFVWSKLLPDMRTLLRGLFRNWVRIVLILFVANFLLRYFGLV